jgi:hypothetical protein
MTIQTIEGLYVGYFGRAADPAGLNYWLGQETTNSPPGLLTDTQIASSFAVQAETMALYPSLATPALLDSSQQAEANFINSIYQNLFGHAADTAGLSYWQGQLTAGVSPGIMISQIISGAQGTDSTAFSSKVGVATTYTTSVLNASPSVTWSKNDATASKSILATVTTAATASATSASITAAITADQSGNSGTAGVTLTLPSTGGTLTSGGATIQTVVISPTATGTGTQQTINGANNTIRALQIGDLNSSVFINGGTGGLNTLNAVIGVQNSVTNPVNPILQNVQMVNLDPEYGTGTTPAASITFSATGDSGLGTITEAAGSISSAPSNNLTLTVSGIATSVALGMSNVTSAGNPTTGDSLLGSFTGLTATGNSETLVLSGNQSGTFDTLTSSGNGINTYNIQSTGKSNTVTIGGANDSALQAMNITGSTALTLINQNFSAGLATINGSAATGSLNITTGALTGKATISGGSGALDIINAGAAGAAVTLSDGGGTDTLTYNGSIAGNVINAGTGQDTIQTVSGVGLANLTKAGDLTTNGTTAGTIGGDIETLNNYVAGTTTIYLPGINATYAVATNTVENNIASAVGVVAAGNLLSAVSAAAKQVTTGKTVAWFSYGGDEYVYQANTGAGALANGDGLLKVSLAGSTTFKLTASNLT